MGRSKPLLPLDNRPAILRLLQTLFSAGMEEIVVVLGPDGDAVAEAIGSFPTTVVWNREPDSDMAASLRVGISSLAPGAAGVLVWPADSPLVAPTTLRRLLIGFTADPQSIWLPTHGGRRGHPVLFPRPVLEELFELPTLRDVVRRDPERVRHLEVADPWVLLDIDTPEDYRRVLEILQGAKP